MNTEVIPYLLFQIKVNSYDSKTHTMQTKSSVPSDLLT